MSRARSSWLRYVTFPSVDSPYVAIVLGHVYKPRDSSSPEMRFGKAMLT